MRCKQANKLISIAHDGQLDADRQIALDAHLAGCDNCRAFAAQLSAMDDQLSTLSAPEVRWGLAQRILARLPEQGAQANNLTAKERSALPRRWADLLKPAPLGLSLASLVLGVWMGGMLDGFHPSNGTGAEDLYASTEFAGIFDALPDDSPGGALYAMLDDDLDESSSSDNGGGVNQ